MDESFFFLSSAFGAARLAKKLRRNIISIISMWRHTNEPQSRKFRTELVRPTCQIAQMAGKQVENVIKSGSRWAGRDNDLRHPNRSKCASRSFARFLEAADTVSDSASARSADSHSGLRPKGVHQRRRSTNVSREARENSFCLLFDSSDCRFKCGFMLITFGGCTL